MINISEVNFTSFYEESKVLCSLDLPSGVPVEVLIILQVVIVFSVLFIIYLDRKYTFSKNELLFFSIIQMIILYIIIKLYSYNLIISQFI